MNPRGPKRPLALLAQSGKEQLAHNEQVAGSNPAGSTKLKLDVNVIDSVV